MSVLDTLRAEEARLAAIHEEHAAKCNAARKARDDAAAALAQAKEAAGAAWNELEGVRASIRELEKRARPAAVTGTGDLKTEGSK